MPLRTWVAAFIVVSAAISGAYAEEYQEVKLVHWKTEGFATVMHQYGDHWTFFVTNGAATMIFKRDLELSAPNIVYTDNGDTATLTLSKKIERKYDCINHYDVRQGWPDEHCLASCQPCVCVECLYEITGNSTSLPTLEVGP
jgi:hypothetical protein